jgi:hypothetical protein
VWRPPELDEVLRREEDFIALSQQLGQSMSGDGMVRRGRISEAQQQIRVGEVSGHQS